MNTHRSEYERVILTDVDERTAPASLPVLQVTVVDQTVFLTTAAMEETNKITTFTHINTIAVDRAALLSVLLGVPEGISVQHVEERTKQG